MKIPFHVRYKDEIIKGDFRVITANGDPVRIICWDKEVSDRKDIVALVRASSTNNEYTKEYYSDGTLISNGKQDLFIVPKFLNGDDLSKLALYYAFQAYMGLVDTYGKDLSFKKE